MLNLKKISCVLWAIASAGATLAQNNAFPISGNVGIGTPNPQLKLDIQGGGASISGVNPISSINGFRNLLQLKNPSHAAIVYNPGEDNELMFGFHSTGRFFWGSKATGYQMVLNDAGDLQVYNRVQIGREQYMEGYALSVGGNVVAKEVKVTHSGWADHVFQPDYKLRPLDEVQTYIQNYGHLPGIPTADEVIREGIDLGEMNKKLLEKIEELTLYLLEERQAREALEERINRMETTKESK
ncbi:hypothetical protein ACFOET_06775 [Parapedobacter deserti]|uniref:BZIP transcription factor n=1 Tax=Parapedobacter deserti TaxID=1912957 RepID=A0ABV7JGT7_9SPHI